MAEKTAFDVEELLLRTPLYSPISVVKAEQHATVKDILAFEATIDVFCPGCGEGATFRGVVDADVRQQLKNNAIPVSIGGSRQYYRLTLFDATVFAKKLQCTRREHILRFYFVMDDERLVKVGQYPSLADIHLADTKRYQKLLPKAQLNDLNKGIGLAAHGVGVGSYVYLRRVFETLIEEAHAVAATDASWDEASYATKSRFAERVQMLKHLLPSFLVDHPQLYGILSRGLHELTEEECLANFDALKLAITVVLDQKLADDLRRAQEAAARRAVAAITSENKPKP